MPSSQSLVTKKTARKVNGNAEHNCATRCCLYNPYCSTLRFLRGLVSLLTQTSNSALG